MTPGARKLLLTAHVTCSVGWLGAVAVFLALALFGLASDDATKVRAVYVACDLVGWLVIVPLSLASLATGIIQALVTPWGLLRHYWVLIKLVITTLATAILMIHMRPIGHVARLAAEAGLSSTAERGLRIQIVADAAMALLALLAATTLSVFKPRGLTSLGRRRQAQR